MRLLLDEHIGRAVAEGLRKLGHDAIILADAGLLGEDDLVIWKFAVSERRAIVTYNRDDFVGLATRSMMQEELFPGVIIISAKTVRQEDVGGLIKALDALIQNYPDVTGQFHYLRKSPSR